MRLVQEPRQRLATRTGLHARGWVQLPLGWFEAPRDATRVLILTF